jgi:hypothetical protein
MRRDAGQASLEYVGVVAVVAVVLALLSAPAWSGEQAAGAVVGQLHRALCVVAHGDCDEGRRPCVLASDAVADAGHVDVLVLHTGSRELVLRERMSDGRVAVTFLREGENGLALGGGTAGHVRIGRRVLDAGTDLSARLLLLSGEGRTWVLSPARADALVRRLVVDDAGDLADRVAHGGAHVDGFPPPAQTATQHGLRVELGGAVRLGGVAASVTLGAQDLAGSTLDAATGRRTYLLRRTDDLGGALSSGGRALAEGHGTLDTAYTITVDRNGRPVDLGVLQAGELRGGADLPGPAQEVAGALGVPSSGARRWELERHLDLTDAANLDAARAFVADVLAGGARVGAPVRSGAALGERLDVAGVTDARTYAVADDATGVEADGEAGLVRLGAGFERARRSTRLLAAMQRGPDGVWRSRADCRAATT